MDNQQNQPQKRNSNVIYFLIVVVAALLITDVYLWFNNKKSDNERIVYQNDNKGLQAQKTHLETQIDSLETQVEQANTGKAKLSKALMASNDSLKAKIKNLRVKLYNGKLTAEELTKAQEDVKQLRYFVTKYTTDIEDLKKQNASLASERDTLKTNLATVSEKATTLQKQNEDLNTKVTIASALKVGNINVTPLKVRSSGKEVAKTRAGATKKIKIDFTVAGNAVAEKRLHDVFVRVIDPTGNLITSTDSGNFQTDGQELQFTYKTAIDFKDDGSGYTIEWTNPNPFQKGVYTVLLYADGYTMGKTSFTLK
jgi:septal ring factor EnvC (AmiA/AmiB activator)